MSSILLDTNILIYLLEGNVTVREILEDKAWHISFITEMELLMKPDAQQLELKSIHALLNECFIIEMNSAIKDQAIKNAGKFRLKLADSIILATAQVNNLSLLTADSEFKKAPIENVLIFVP